MPPTSASPNAHFLAGDLPAAGQLGSHGWQGTGLSILVHAIGLAALLYAATHPSQAANIVKAAAANSALIYLPVKGAASGGGDGPADPSPPRPAEIAPARPIDPVTPIPEPRDIPTPDVIVSMQTPQASMTIPGTLSPLEVPGPGGAGSTKGAGMDGGRGNGAGPGENGNYGGGPRQVGNGVTAPVLVHEVRPNYTADAMRAKLQGAVEMEAVVRPDGTVDPKSIKITRSLDSTFGLDEQAIIAVRQWRFRPGTLRGEPVAVIVSVELTFTLR